MKIEFNKQELKKLLQYSKLAEVYAENFDDTDVYIREKIKTAISDNIKKGLRK